jgi:uroporphyrinogen-III synthase
MAIAEDAGRADELRAAFATNVAAVAVGPVTAAAAERAGVELAASPAVGRLGLMVRALVAALDARHQHLVVERGEIVLRGALVHDGVRSIELATKERAVLHTLARNAGLVATKGSLAQQVWGSPVETVALDATVARLRRKLGPLGVQIVSRPRRGYQLDAVAARCSRGGAVSSATAPVP